jgi:hypothetical protein
VSFIFDASDHARLATLFDGVSGPGPCRGFVPYAGYKPETREAPNGDTKACPRAECDGGYTCYGPGTPISKCLVCHGTGRVPNVDTGKRYLHVSLSDNPPAWALEYLARAHWEACRVATALGVPPEFRPHEADATLRVLEYPAGAGSAEHTDFDLFTILCWRSTPGDLELTAPSENTTAEAIEQTRRRIAARSLSPGLHIGELGELVGLGPATPHRVPARPYVQKSIVYFAMPDHGARLPPLYRDQPNFPPTVGEWVAERIARSRVGGYT